MTQILALLTQQYVLVASDRRLTFTTGSRKGQIADDKSCKLVSLCGMWGIAYTGFAKIQSVPTNEWIAIRLAEQNCRSPYAAAQILAGAAVQALGSDLGELELTFLIAGWVKSDDSQVLQSHFLLVSNMRESSGDKRPSPGRDFNCFERKLGTNEGYAARVIGQPLLDGRGKQLDRLLRRALTHGTGPKPVMQAFVREIGTTSGSRSTVGEQILAFSIPRNAAERVYQTGQQMMLATEPNLDTTVFCSFEPAYNRARQYGPTCVCGESAVTDIETQDEPSRDLQSSNMRILYLPKPPQVQGGQTSA